MTYPIPHWYKPSPLWLIPQDWEVLKLVKLWDISSWGTPDTNDKSYRNGTINWCTPTDITAIENGKYIFHTKTKITESWLKNSSAKLLPPNSIVVCTRATIWKAVITKETMTTNQWFKNIIPNATIIDTDFLYYKILAEEGNLKRLWNWSTFLEVSKKDFENHEICLPKTIPEQHAIASILSTCDESITTTQTLIDRLQRRHKALGKQLLTGKKRLQGFSEEWEMVKLWDIIEFHEEKTKETNKYVVFTSSKLWLVLQTDYYSNNRLTERDNTWFNVLPDWFITYRSRSDDAKFTFNINNYWVTWIVSKYYPVFRLKNWSNYILVQILNMYQSKIWSYSVWTSQLVLGIKELKNIILKIPSPEEQTAIASILNASQTQIDLAQAKLIKLKQQKQGMMQQLLTGKTRVPSDYL